MPHNVPLHVHKEYVCSTRSLCCHTQLVPVQQVASSSLVSAAAAVFSALMALFLASWLHLMGVNNS